jgi:ABC-type Fe3+ transport system permease subunit
MMTLSLMMMAFMMLMLVLVLVLMMMWITWGAGSVIEGYDEVVKKIEEVGSSSGTTSKDVVIEDCGEL